MQKPGKGAAGMSAKDIQLYELKDTIAQLNTQLRIQNELLVSLKEELEKSRASSEEKDKLIISLQEQLAYMKKKLFGSSSERSKDIPGQISMFEAGEEGTPTESAEEPDNPAETLDAEYVIPEKPEKKPRKPKTKLVDQFNLLPTRKEIIDTLTDEQKKCSVCGTPLEVIGHEYLRTEIVYTPPKYEKVEIYGTTYGCRNCRDTAEKAFILQDPGIPALIPHSYASASLAAKIMVDKYVKSLPLYRQEQEMMLLGVPVSRTSMATWIITATDLYLKPFYDYLHRQLLLRRFLMSDETPLQVLKEPGRKAQSKSYIWLIRSGEDGLPVIMLYHYTMTRAGDNAAEFLSGAAPGFYYMADGFSGYNKLKNGKRCCCWAHVRRKLFEAIPKGREKDYTDPAVQGFLYCEKLFAYERQYKAKGLTHEKIMEKRLKDELPVIDAFLKWAENQKPVKGSRLDKAITYIRNQSPYMKTYLEDGRCSLSNNLSENSIRPVAVGRKNWLFSDTQAGANASMIVYTMTEMAKKHGLDPYKYLKYLLDVRLEKGTADEEFEKNVPWNPEIQELCKPQK